MRNQLKELNERVAAACAKSGRDPNTVTLVAVSKGHPVDKIAEAYELGVRDFGENYAAEMAEKMQALAAQCPQIRWHFVGHIQGNKLKLISKATWIHSVSEIRHASALVECKSNALMQVNLGEQDNRSGVILVDAVNRYIAIKMLMGERLCGLMTIAPQVSGVKPRVWFGKMKDLRDELEQKSGQVVPELSMGMSADFEDAIAFGATFIRVGTLLFGEREIPR